MKNTLKNIGIGILGLVLIIAVVFGAGILNLESFKFFAPKREEARRKVFEETKSYRHGTLQELDKMKQEYFGTKDPDFRKAIMDRAKRMTAELERDSLPSDIRQWLYSAEAQ